MSDERCCERCREIKPNSEFPPPRRLGGLPRPFCIRCTNFIHWTNASPR